jgi:hypothetical protein
MYDPKLLKFRRVIPGSIVGVSLVVDKSLLGEDWSDLVDENHLSSIELTDGYNVGSGGELSIDPLTGTASFAERRNAAPGEAVESWAEQHPMYTGTGWELRYNNTIVAQGKVTKVETNVSTDGLFWVKKTRYTLSGAAVTMLNQTVSWGTTLPLEGALVRLRRFFTVDTSACRSTVVTYLDTVKAPSTAAGSSTLLDLARDFTELTKFPVRTENTNSPVVGLTVVPGAVTFQGVPPPPLMLPSASTWTVAADMLSDVNKPPFTIPPEKVQSVEVRKDYDLFIAGVGEQAFDVGRVDVDFLLGQSRVARSPGAPPPVAVRTPAAIDFFGSLRVVSQINHSFAGNHYRSALTLTTPTEAT